MIKNNVFGKAALTGIAAIIISLWMMMASKVETAGIWMPAGFKMPILALGFASNTQEISRMVASILPESNKRIIAGIQIDMLFLVAYNLFLFFVLRAIYKITNLKQYKWLALLPFVIMLADAGENYQLSLVLSNFKYSIVVLQIATWVKWFGLAISFGAIGRFLITTGRYYDKVLALSCFIALPLGIWAMFAHNSINEVFAMLFYLLFPMMVIYTWWPEVRRKM